MQEEPPLKGHLFFPLKSSIRSQLRYWPLFIRPQVFVSSVGILLGASMFGPISIYGIVASESFPAHLSGTAHAVVALAANGKYCFSRQEKTKNKKKNVYI